MKNKDEYSAFTTSAKTIKNQLINKASVIYNDKKFDVDKALWDTGATSTCISTNVVEQLGLISIGKKLIQTPSGTSLRDEYIIDIELPNKVIIRDLSVIDSEIGKQKIDLLIGMDIISQGDFSVTNYDGATIFSYRSPSQSNIDFVQMIRNRQPVVNGTKTSRNDLCPCGSGKKYKHCCGKIK